MSISADPIFVQAEVAYRRESMQAAGLPPVEHAPRHHASRIRLALRGVRAGTRHARHTRHTARPA
jgi:hypothetical protein